MYTIVVTTFNLNAKNKLVIIFVLKVEVYSSRNKSEICERKC